MNRTINRRILILGMLAIAGPVMTAQVFGQTVSLEAAKQEGKVNVYGAQVPQAMKPLHAAFEKKYGITVEYWRGSSTQVSERALTEWRAGKPGFDVVEGNHAAGRQARPQRV